MTAGTCPVHAASAPDFPSRRDGDPLDPPAAHRAWQRRAPITAVRLWDGRPAWLVSGHDAARDVLRSPHVSSDPAQPGLPTLTRGRPVALPGFFIQMDDPEHARLRRMLTREFMVRRIAALRPAIDAEVRRLLGTFLSGPCPADLVTGFAVRVPPPVFARFLGVAEADRDTFCAAAETLLLPGTDAEAAGAAGQTLQDTLRRTATHRATHPGDDVLSRLVGRRERDGEIDRGTAVGLAMMIVVAGHDTLSTTIATGLLALQRDPAGLARLRADPSRVPAAVEELVRFLTPIHRGLPRLLLADLEVAGTRMRAGDAVVVDLATANRDPRAFADPDSLDVGRDARAHLGFGFGVHQCVGQTLARAVLCSTFTALLDAGPPALAVADDELRYRHDMTVYGATSVPVRWTRQKRRTRCKHHFRSGSG